MKTLPEAGKKPLGAEEQLRMLLKKLAGHKVFGRCRGVFEHLPIEDILEVDSDVPPSPSAIQKAFSKLVSDRKVMLTMLAQLKRDGYSVAFEELYRALCEEDRIITSETVPVEQTEPGVLVMIDPKHVFLTLRWMYTTSQRDAYNWVTHGIIHPNRTPCGSLSSRFFGAFPYLIHRASGYMSEPTPKSPFELILFDRIEWMRRELSSGLVGGSGNLLPMKVDPGKTDTWRVNPTVAFFVRGKDQAEVLSCFEREEQDHIATWRFDYPKFDAYKMMVHSSPGPTMWIGFHPESEHERWQHQWPSYASRGVACGHGAVILDKERVGIPGWKTCSLEPYDPLQGPNPQFCQGDLMSRRLVISFDYGGG